MWDPGQYLTYAEERARPFFDLLARVSADAPGLVVDLGCGPGNLTAVLAERWPGADVLGVDSSPEMINAARAGTPGRIRFELGDVREWRPERAADVLVCNAVLQWVPDHLTLVRSWPALLAPGGWLAFQVPANAGPAQDILDELAVAPRWREELRGVALNRQASDPARYLGALAAAGCEVDAWETTYLHVLPGTDPVARWYRGTALRPVLAALGEADAAEFLASYAERTRAAYPAAPYGTVLPFRRVFVVARRA